LEEPAQIVRPDGHYFAAVGNGIDFIVEGLVNEVSVLLCQSRCRCRKRSSVSSCVPMS